MTLNCQIDPNNCDPNKVMEVSAKVSQLIRDSQTTADEAFTVLFSNLVVISEKMNSDDPLAVIKNAIKMYGVLLEKKAHAIKILLQ